MHRRIRHPAERPHARRAFTLVEMLVSLAVVSVALVVVVTAFTITTRTARQAAAYSEASAWVRQFAQQIEEDLAYCVPSESVLVLVGRKQAAALTTDDLAAQRRYRVLLGDPTAPNAANEFRSAGGGQSSDPRADLLMFFTNRPTVSQSPALSIDESRIDSDARVRREVAYARGAKFAPALVAYGHAALGRYEARSNGEHFFAPLDLQRDSIVNLNYAPGNPDQSQNLSPFPANQWHLARRATIIESPLGTASNQRLELQFAHNDGFEAIRRGLLDPRNGNNRSYAADAAMFRLADFLRLASDPSGFLGLRSTSLYDLSSGSPVLQVVNRLLYGNASGTEVNYRHLATVLPTPPADLRRNLGVHLLPGCAWFQVEFLAPEDPFNSARYQQAGDDYARSSDDLRWMSVEPERTYVFAPDSLENRAALLQTERLIRDFQPLNPEFRPNPDVPQNRVVRLWPYAIRVTVRVFDPRGRLPEPIVRTIVHRFE
jgi:prepilin-type N-terminal cleavage/methylation domain-containing protein